MIHQFGLRVANLNDVDESSLADPDEILNTDRLSQAVRWVWHVDQPMLVANVATCVFQAEEPRHETGEIQANDLPLPSIDLLPLYHREIKALPERCCSPEVVMIGDGDEVE